MQTTGRFAHLPYRPCVGVMLINRDGLIFGGQRIDTDAPAWQMPQGGIEPGEAPQDAALRELFEETGIPANRVEVIGAATETQRYDLPDDLVPRIWKGRFRGQEQNWFLMRYLGRDDEIDIASEHPEFSQWRWLRAADMLDAIVPFKREVYQRVIADFAEFLA
jgi:putative (di)nucleoside polyphosphate hydrolase